MSAVIFGIPCRTCGKAVTPAVDDRVGGDDLRGHICETCYADEQKAYSALLDHLAQQPAEMAHCEECLKTLDVIERETGLRKLYMQVSDGVVALLCRGCSDKAAALASTATVAGRFKHLSREELYQRFIREHWQKLRRMVRGART